MHFGIKFVPVCVPHQQSLSNIDIISSTNSSEAQTPAKEFVQCCCCSFVCITHLAETMYMGMGFEMMSFVESPISKNRNGQGSKLLSGALMEIRIPHKMRFV